MPDSDKTQAESKAIERQGDCREAKGEGRVSTSIFLVVAAKAVAWALVPRCDVV